MYLWLRLSLPISGFCGSCSVIVYYRDDHYIDYLNIPPWFQLVFDWNILILGYKRNLLKWNQKWMDGSPWILLKQLKRKKTKHKQHISSKEPSSVNHKKRNFSIDIMTITHMNVKYHIFAVTDGCIWSVSVF